MSRDLFQMVGDFHRKFYLENVSPDRNYGGPPPLLLTSDSWDFRVRFLREELRETENAYLMRNLPLVADGLADLVYVALGTAHMLRLPFNEVFAEVHSANMRKERAASAADPRSVRGHKLDVVKPAGWMPPDVIGVLLRHGWPGTIPDEK